MNGSGIRFGWQNRKSVYPNVFINIMVRRSNNAERECTTRCAIFRFHFEAKINKLFE